MYEYVYEVYRYEVYESSGMPKRGAGGGVCPQLEGGDFLRVSVTTRPVLIEAFPGPADAGATSDCPGGSPTESRGGAGFFCERVCDKRWEYS